MLDAMGKIQEIHGKVKHKVLTKGYLAAMDKGKSTLVVATMHVESPVGL